MARPHPVSASTQVSGKQVARLNARIDRLPTWGLSRWVFLALGLSYFFVYYDITAFGVNLPVMLDDLRLTEAASGPAITGNLIAYIVGSYALGSAADYIGRRNALVISVAILAAGSVLTALSWDLFSLTLFRVITGLGMGAQIALAATLVGELSNARSRGRFLALNTLWAGAGFVVTPFLGMALLPLGGLGWRVLFAIPVLSLLVLAFCRDAAMPESPRWLVLHARAERAERIVAGMERIAQRRAGGALPEVPRVPAEDHVTGFPTRQLLSRQYLPRLLLVFAFWTVFYMWIYGYLGYQPTLLGEMGIDVPSGLLYTGLGYLGFLVGGLVTPVLIDHVERKTMVGLGIGVAVVGFLVLTFSAGPATVILGELFVGFGNISAVTAAYTYTTEVFPTRARASAMAIGDGLGHVGGAIVPYIVLALLGAVGPAPVFGGFAVLAALSLLLILGGVRTSKRGLTRLSQ